MCSATPGEPGSSSSRVAAVLIAPPATIWTTSSPTPNPFGVDDHLVICDGVTVSVHVLHYPTPSSRVRAMIAVSARLGRVVVVVVGAVLAAMLAVPATAASTSAPASAGSIVAHPFLGGGIVVKPHILQRRGGVLSHTSSAFAVSLGRSGERAYRRVRGAPSHESALGCSHRAPVVRRDRGVLHRKQDGVPRRGRSHDRQQRASGNAHRHRYERYTLRQHLGGSSFCTRRRGHDRLRSKFERQVLRPDGSPHSHRCTCAARKPWPRHGADPDQHQ